MANMPGRLHQRLPSYKASKHKRCCSLRVNCQAKAVAPARLLEAGEAGSAELAADTGGNDGDDGVHHGNRSCDEDEPDNSFNYEGWSPFRRLTTGIAARRAADPEFVYKICVECGIDAIIIACVNYGARGESFFDELEFVFCQMLVSCANDFALVFLLSPAAGTARVANNWVARYLNSLPPHVLASGLYTPLQRATCFFYKSLQYGAIGFTMGVVGSSAVNRLTDLREMTDESFEPPSEAPSALLTGLGWLYFMGISSNVRYNLIAAAEQMLYRRHPGVPSKLGSIALRLANNFAAAYLWVDLSDEIGVSQPRKSLREERRKRERREARTKWMWWKRKKPDPRPWPWSLLQPQR